MQHALARNFFFLVLPTSSLLTCCSWRFSFPLRIHAATYRTLNIFRRPETWLMFVALIAIYRWTMRIWETETFNYFKWTQHRRRGHDGHCATAKMDEFFNTQLSRLNISFHFYSLRLDSRIGEGLWMGWDLFLSLLAVCSWHSLFQLSRGAHLR